MFKLAIVDRTLNNSSVEAKSQRHSRKQAYGGGEAGVTLIPSLLFFKGFLGKCLGETPHYTRSIIRGTDTVINATTWCLCTHSQTSHIYIVDRIRLTTKIMVQALFVSWKPSVGQLVLQRNSQWDLMFNSTKEPQTWVILSLLLFDENFKYYFS